MRLYRQTVEDFGLYAGQELTAEQMESLEKSAGEMSAKMRAVRIVSATNVSRRDLEQRLVHKGESADQARAAVEWMEDLNLIDDRQTARQIVARCAARGYGAVRVKQLLYEKQIPRELWDEVLADYPDQTEKMVDFLRARLGEEPDRREVQRAVDALRRKGHNWNDIRRALALLTEDADHFVEE